MGRYGRIALKTILWIIAGIITLLLLIVVLIQVPAVQNFVKNKAVTFLENKIHTRVEIGHISLGLPKLLVLEDVYFEDQQKDTLIAGDKLKVDISMLKLLQSEVEINEINLQGITTKVYRGRDSVFNFDYIIKAFAGEQKKEPQPEDTTSTMKFSVDKIILDKINVSYKDLTTGNDVKFYLGHFDTRIKDFDMDKMKFTIPRINLSDVNARIIQTPAGSTIEQTANIDTAVTPLNLDLDLGVIDFSKIKVDYRSNEMDASVDLGKLLVEMDKIDLKNQNVVINNIELNNTGAALRFAKPTTVAKAAEKAVKKLDTIASNPYKSAWRASLGKLIMANNNIKFDNDAQTPIRRGLDFAHMDLRDLNVDLRDLAYSPDTIKGNVKQLTFADKSGFAVKNFHTAFLYGPKSAYLNDLLLETPQTVIQKQLQVTYPSIEAITENIGQLYIKANLNGSKLGLKDVLLLMPTMASMEPFKSSPNSVIRINGNVEGKVNNLNIPNLEVSGFGNTRIKASAKLRGLPDVNKAYFDINIADFRTTSTDIARLVPKGTIPSNVSLPPSMALKGNFRGSMNSFNTRLGLRSSYGAVDLNAVMKNLNTKNATYTADIKADQLNIGALTKQPETVGMVTMTAKVNGRGIDPKTASLELDGNLESAYIKGYTYKNLAIKATGTDGSYEAKATMRDPNITFALDAKANMTKKYPSVSGIFMLDSIDLQKLGFTKDVMRIHGKIIADVPTADPDYLNATIKATDLLVVNKDQRIRMDSITLASTANADSNTLALKTSIITFNMSGKYQLTQIGTALQDVINKYFDTGLASTGIPTVVAAKPGYQPQQARFSMRVVKTPLLQQLAPDLKQLDPININGSFNSSTGQLVVNGTVPKVVYGSSIINNTKLNINTANNALNYSITADEIKPTTSIDLLNTSLSGSVQNNKLNINLQVRDKDKKERYRIAGTLGILPNEYQFSFANDGVMLNYVAWTVNPNNAFLFGNKGLNARNFNLTNADQVLSVNSSSVEMNSPITVNFRNFRIETLTTIAQQDSLQLGGVINGQARVSEFTAATPQFNADLNIGDFSFKGDTVGNIAIKANNQTANAIATTVNISGKGNQVDLDGLYYTEPAGKMDMTLTIVKLNMKSIQGFTYGAIRNASGDITGALRITGTTDAPSVRGDVNFNRVGFNVAMLNSYFTMPRERITFNEEGIYFNDFTLVDSTNNKAIISGTLYTKTFTDYRFGLDITARDFRVMNSTRADNKLYYGTLFLDSDIKIRGTQALPVVDARLTVNEQTDLTIVLPTSDPGVEDRKGVVEFFDESNQKLDSILIARQLDSLKQSELTGIDVSATIIVKKEANFNIVVDERNGDVVRLRGAANLNGGIDKSGKISLTGTYEVEQGSYNLSYATVKRTFIFKKGSTITWTGDPTSANVDLTATYVASVPAIDLVADQLGGSQNQIQYKQKLPFNVNLSMRNELMKPNISFDIVLPDSTYSVSPTVINTVNARLSQIRQDPNELNKQVLGVLVLGHFIGENPLASKGGSTGVNGMIRNSVSGLLSDQLTRLAGDLIQGVDLDFGLSSGADYSSGVETNRTDLNVGLSKRFLDDRLTVSVGNNFNLEGARQGEKTTNIAGNLSVNYKLSKDGRYTIRAYRREQYVVIQGQIIETGVGFTLTVDYNKFIQIFRRSREDREARRRYKNNEERRENMEERREEVQEREAIKADSVRSGQQ